MAAGSEKVMQSLVSHDMPSRISVVINVLHIQFTAVSTCFRKNVTLKCKWKGKHKRLDKFYLSAKQYAVALTAAIHNPLNNLLRTIAQLFAYMHARWHVHFKAGRERS
jgi:hypothetical protein